MVLIAGGQAKLDFSITGDPAPTVQWLQNGEPLADGDGIATVKADVSFQIILVTNHYNGDVKHYQLPISV